MTRIISAALVLGVLILIVAESAKYLYVMQIPKSVSSRIDPSIDKLAAVLGAAKSSLDNTDDVSIGDSSKEKADKVAKVILKIAVLSDSHDDLEYLKKALSEAKSDEVDQIVFLGDYTDYGDVESLKKSKEVMDSAKIPYVSLPGDHDIAQTRDESNFVSVFGSTANNKELSEIYDTFELEDIKFMYFDNSKNYTKIDDSNMEWFKKKIGDIDFLFLSQPLVTSSMSRVMGIIDDVRDEVVFSQNVVLLGEVRESSVKAVISGDLHQFSKFDDPVKKGLRHYSVGAILKSQGLEKLNLQSPRFVILTVYDDKSYRIDDVTID